MKHPASRELYAYWDRLRGARAAPEQAHVDPAALGGFLSSLFVLGVDKDRIFPFRLAGTRICDLFGRELRGENLLDLFTPADRSSIRDTLGAVVEDAAVAVTSIRGIADLDRSIEAELLLLPLRHHGQTHSRLIGSLGLLQGPGWVGSVPLREVSLQMLRLMWPSGRRSGFESSWQAEPASPLEETGSRFGWLRVLEGGRGQTDSPKPDRLTPH